MVAPIPNTSFSFPNNGLGNVPPSPANIIAIVGPTSAGVANTPRPLGGSPANVVSGFGYGPAASLAAALVEGGGNVVLTKAAHTAATPGVVTKTGAGTSVMTVTGTPFDRYDIVVTTTRGGTVGTDLTGAVTISLDGGRTTSKEISVPLSGIVSALASTTGLSFVFDDTVSTDELAVGTTYELHVPAPTLSAADVVTALTALKNSTESYSLIHVTGAFGASDAATIAAEVAAIVARKRFVRIILESVDVTGVDTEAEWAADLATDFVAFSSDLVTVAAGYIGVRDPLTKANLWRSVGWPAIIRAAQVAIHRDLAANEDDPITAIAGGPALLGTAAPDKFVHDEGINPLLNQHRFLTIMSFPGLPGYYITNPNVMSGPTSDYDLLQYGRIADEAARLTNFYFTKRLSGDVFLDPTTGKILESEARGWEEGNNQALLPLITNRSVSARSTSVDRTPVGRTVSVTVRFVPKFYAKEFAVTIAFTPTIAAA